MTTNGNGNGNGHDKAIRIVALDFFKQDMGRLRELAEAREDDAAWALAAGLVDSAMRNSGIAFELSGTALRETSTALAKADAAPPADESKPTSERWLEKVKRRVRGASANRHLVHAAMGTRLACDPKKIIWGNTVGRHLNGCAVCREAYEANRVRDTGETILVDGPAERPAKKAKAAPRSSRRMRTLKGGKRRKARVAV